MVLVSVYGNVVLSFIGDFTKVANIAKIKIYKFLGIMNASFWRLSGLVPGNLIFEILNFFETSFLKLTGRLLILN